MLWNYSEKKKKKKNSIEKLNLTWNKQTNFNNNKSCPLSSPKRVENFKPLIWQSPPLPPLSPPPSEVDENFRSPKAGPNKIG